MTDFRLEVQVDPNLPAVVEGAVSFKTSTTMGPLTYCAPRALTSFWEDLIFGRPMPLSFATLAVDDVDTLVAIALFMHRDIAIQAETAGFVSAVDLVVQWGLPAFAHIPQDVGTFIRFLRNHIQEGTTVQQKGERLGEAVSWVRDFLVGDTLPSITFEQPKAKIIQQGTGGFVVATIEGDLFDGWVDLFRGGHLKGFVLGPDVDGRRPALVARKTVYVPFDLARAATHLNELEQAIRAPLPFSPWEHAGDFLSSAGTVISPTQILEILIRV